MSKTRGHLHGDDGASLVLALLIITAVALVTVTMLGQSFTNTAVTITARQVAATQYSADAAAQYAANQLRLSDLTSGLCSSNTAVTSEDLSNFYPAGLTTVAQKAHVDCAPDPGNGEVPGGGGNAQCPTIGLCPNESPGTALLTLDPNVGDTGIYVSTNGGTVKIRGGVFSNAKIAVVQGGLENTWCPATTSGGTDCTKTSPQTYVIARDTCSPGITFDQSGAMTQCRYPTANDPRGADPGIARTGYTPAQSYNTPAAPAAFATSQSCKNSGCAADTPASTCASGAKYQQVLPGLVTATLLASLTGCSNAIIQFTPGTYYFTSAWTIPNSTTVVGGTFASGYDPVAGTGPAASGWLTNGGDYADACIAPGATGASTSSGVEFVMGGAAQFAINGNGTIGSHLTICASNAADGPPMAVYGLKTAIGSGAMAISASNLCTSTGTGTTACALIQTANSPKATLNIVGMTYATRSTIDVVLNNTSSKLFYWGVVSYAIEFGSTGSANLSANLVDVQDGWPSPFTPTNRFFLNVYTCAATAASCPAAGASPNTTEVVQVGNDLTGSALPTGNILVLGWSDKR